MKKILITGANGLIGTRLQQMLGENGYSINTIGRAKDHEADNNPKSKIKSQSYIWDVRGQKMDVKALEGVDAIVHLAGAGVADKRWTEQRKKEIMDSRIDSTKLLYDTLSKISHQVKTIVSASAVGYYGDQGAEILTEEHAPGSNFLAKVTCRWEAEVARFAAIGIRHVSCRIGIVLAKDGGALPELTRTLPVGVAGYFAKNPLYYPWIHIDDVCGIMIHALRNNTLNGSYNTCAPNPVQIKELMRAIVKAKKSHAILMPVPPFALKLAMGEMAEMILSSQQCSDDKIILTGYKFYYPELNLALRQIFSLEE